MGCAEDDGSRDDKLTREESHRLLNAMRTKRPGSFALFTTEQLGRDGDPISPKASSRHGRSDISKKKPVPKEVPVVTELAYALLRHCRRLAKLGYRVDGDAWLFPSRAGGLKSPSSLVTAIRKSAKDAELQQRITPHMMRYLFNDVLRLAGIDQVKRKALSGHVTDEMTDHYSRVRLDEKRAAMEAAAAKIRDVKVAPEVAPHPEKKKAA